MHCRAFTRPLPRVRDPLRKKKRKRKFSYFPVLPDLFRSFGVCHPSAALHPPLDATYLQPWGPSNLLLRPSALIPSNYLTHTSDLKTYIHLLPPSPLMLRLGLSVLRCFPPFASSSHLRTSLFRRSALASLRPHFTHRKFPSRSRNHASAPLP